MQPRRQLRGRGYLLLLRVAHGRDEHLRAEFGRPVHERHWVRVYGPRFSLVEQFFTPVQHRDARRKLHLLLLPTDWDRDEHVRRRLHERVM